MLLLPTLVSKALQPSFYMDTQTNNAAHTATPNGNTKQAIEILVGGKMPFALEDKPVIETGNFMSVIGSILDANNKTIVKDAATKRDKLTFVIKDETQNGLLVSIPSETANNDTLTRIIKAMQDVTKQMFAGYLLEEETKNPVHISILSSMEKTGIKFSTFTKVAVNKAVKAWAENKRLKVQIVTEKAKQDNLRLYAENEVMKPEIKLIRDENTKQIAGILPEVKGKLHLFLSKK